MTNSASPDAFSPFICAANKLNNNKVQLSPKKLKRKLGFSLGAKKTKAKMPVEVLFPSNLATHEVCHGGRVITVAASSLNFTQNSLVSYALSPALHFLPCFLFFFFKIHLQSDFLFFLIAQRIVAHLQHSNIFSNSNESFFRISLFANTVLVPLIFTLSHR